MRITGIHHVTAITGALQHNVDFYVGTLGLRLAKRTVIQEEPTSYHLFYGDAVGSVGTGLTFFDWPNVGRDRPGPRNVVRTLLAVAGEAALPWWRDRFARLGVEYADRVDHAGRAALHFTDPEGQRLGIVAAGAFPAYRHWAANAAPESAALQAIHSVHLGVSEVEPTVRFLTDVFDYQVIISARSTEAHEGELVALSLGANGGVGQELVVIERVDPQPGFRGIGSVHHVALTIAPDDSIEDWRERLLATGLKVTDVIRRHYFDSVYVRIPGGTQFELATPGPGLAIDEDVAALGHRLTLPPFLEARRAELEAALKPITIPQPIRLEGDPEGVS